MSYQHLNEKERYVISHLQYNYSIREIARRLGRSHSTISREFKRAKAGELSEFVLAHKIDIDKKEETLLDFMEDIDGLRQSIMIVQITEDEDEQVLYTNRSGEEYYSNQCLD